MTSPPSSVTDRCIARCKEQTRADERSSKDVLPHQALEVHCSNSGAIGPNDIAQLKGAAPRVIIAHRYRA